MKKLIIRHLGLCEYSVIYQRMQQFTLQRTEADADEIWLLEHLPVFTQGLAGKAEHILNPLNIPLVQTDRGGQVTYHGPGQLVAYTLFNLQRHQIHIRELVTRLEKSMIQLLAVYQIAAHSKPDAPGVYIQGAKIGSIGLRVKNDCAYHGLALNIAMDLTPFQQINPCGFSGLKITQMKDFVADVKLAEVASGLIEAIQSLFHFDSHEAVFDAAIR